MLTQEIDVTNEPFFIWDGDTLVLNILGTPGASRNANGKPRGNQLKVSVATAPEQGKATDAMVKFLAIQFGVPASRIEVVFGRTSIHKQLRIHAPQKIPAVLCPWIDK
jgi:uncharacterized protein (TIGR00251 family)